jgi:hypothetical protein
MLRSRYEFVVFFWVKEVENLGPILRASASMLYEERTYSDCHGNGDLSRTRINIEG